MTSPASKFLFLLLIIQQQIPELTQIYSGFIAEPFAGFLSKETGYKVAVGRPINYFKLATKVFLAVAAAAVLKFLYRHFSAIIFHKTTWTIISIIIILTFTSGFMWNRIRNPPFLSPGQNGQINYIASG